MPELLAHPQARTPLRCRCRAQAAWSATDRLALRYELEGELAGLLLPAPVAEPARRDGLWQNTCFELFMRRPGQLTYLEANFAPSGHWAAWVFRDCRSDAAAIDMSAPRVEVLRHEAQAFVLQAELQLSAGLLARLSPGVEHAGTVPWQLGLCAVLETPAGELAYWALAHPQQRADFHDVAGHTLMLAPLHDAARSLA